LFYELFETLLIFIICIMFMFFCSTLAVIQLLHVSPGSYKSFQSLATLVLFWVINVFLWCCVFKQMNFMMLTMVVIKNCICLSVSCWRSLCIDTQRWRMSIIREDMWEFNGHSNIGRNQLILTRHQE